MVLSSTYSMPPKQYPPSVLESLAAMAKNLSKLVDTMTVNNEKLAASQSKLNVAIKNLATQNERLSAIITNTPKPENTMAKYFPNSTSYVMPLTYKPPPLEEASTNLADTRAKCFPEPTCYTMKPEINSKDIVTQNTTTINVNTTVNKTDIEVVTYTSPPTPFPEIVQHDRGTLHLTTLHQTWDFSTLVKDKLVIAFASSITKIQNEVAPQTRVTLPLVIEDMLAILLCLETFPPGHQCSPPKFVILQSEDEPPWEPHNLKYITMSLEDKARFQARSIDTCMMS
ncbi:hypothetical protein Tco_0461422 [Tanacetum coccineum]